MKQMRYNDIVLIFLFNIPQILQIFQGAHQSIVHVWVQQIPTGTYIMCTPCTCIYACDFHLRTVGDQYFPFTNDQTVVMTASPSPCKSFQLTFVSQILDETLDTRRTIVDFIFIMFQEVASQSSRELKDTPELPLDTAAPVYNVPWAWTPLRVNTCDQGSSPLYVFTQTLNYSNRQFYLSENLFFFSTMITQLHYFCSQIVQQNYYESCETQQSVIQRHYYSQACHKGGK